MCPNIIEIIEIIEIGGFRFVPSALALPSSFTVAFVFLLLVRHSIQAVWLRLPMSRLGNAQACLALLSLLHRLMLSSHSFVGSFSFSLYNIYNVWLKKLGCCVIKVALLLCRSLESSYLCNRKQGTTPPIWEASASCAAREKSSLRDLHRQERCSTGNKC